MTIAQMEHIATLTDQEVFDRMEHLCTKRRREMVTAKNRRDRLAAFDNRHSETDWQASDERVRLANELTQAEMRRAEAESEIGDAIIEASAPELLSIAEGVLTALRYPRGSEAQIRCLEEIGQDAQSAIAKAKTSETLSATGSGAGHGEQQKSATI